MKITQPSVLSPNLSGELENIPDNIIEISILSPVNVLENIAIGDQIMDQHGKNGEVAEIEIMRYRRETHYYFKLKARCGTILVIR